MMYPTLTDDADHMPGGCDTFDYCPVGGRDAMYDDSPGGGPKCGGPHRDEWGEPDGCPGCKHCDPPDPESIHTGFEIWDRPDFYRLRRELECSAKLGLCLPPYQEVGRYRSNQATLWFEKWIGFNRRLRNAAVRKLDRICDESATHKDALATYIAWVATVKTKLFM